MIKRIVMATILIVASVLTGCASVPLAPIEQDMAAKRFAKPVGNKAGLYVFRDTFLGQGLRKLLYLDGSFLGQTANKVFFFKEITPGSHTLSTESEFGKNSVSFQAERGNNYFAEQYIKMGVFIGGANVRMISEEEGMKRVLRCKLAKTLQ